jgi:protein phosphatase
LKFSARSHTGLVRRNNEDNLYCDGTILTPRTREAPFSLRGEVDVPCIFAVCDGMGGEEDGEFASLTAVTTLAEHAKKIESAGSADEIHGAVQEFVTDANKRVCDAMRERSVRMGTTLALVVVTDDAIYPYNLGDSRIYAMQGGKFSRVSEDHTLAAQKVKIGVITEEEASTDHDRNRLTRHLGIFEDEMTVAAATSDPLMLDRGCRVLLCSDGLTDMVANVRIEEIVRASPTPEIAVDCLMAEALEHGGRDNVTCIVVDVPARAESPSANAALGSVKRGFWRNILHFLSRIYVVEASRA